MRPSATVVVPVWNSWPFTRACLETLRPTLGPRDRVVVVDNGSSDATAAGLARYPWLTVVSNETNRGFAVACNQGAAQAVTEVTVFLNNDTLLAGRWLDDLLEPFADPQVGATGPRSNCVSGDQLVEKVGYASGAMGELRSWVRQWHEDHRRQSSSTTRLVGFCLAVRRSALEEVGGWDEGFEIGGYEDDDLCARLVAAGWALVIAHASFVHHHGHATFDANGLDWLAVQNTNQKRFAAKQAARRGRALLVACIIAKDEELTLPRCLSSLDGVVDEVVVYDTGSTDNTVAVARAAGAKVVEGYWDDDFSRARNDALESCRATWVLSIDADEVLECDPASLRATLDQADEADAIQIPICNLEGTSEHHRRSIEHQAFRLLRPERACWQGRLHEQPVARAGQADLRRAALPYARLVHWGYLTDIAQKLSKPERNLRLAELDVADVPGTDSYRLYNLARSLMWAGRLAEAFQRLAEARQTAADARQECQALRFGIDVLLLLNRTADAGDWVAALRANAAANPSLISFYHGVVSLSAGQPEDALRHFDGLETIECEDGSLYSPGLVEAKRGLALAALARWTEAATELRVAAKTSSEPIWGQLVAAQSLSGGDLIDLVADVEETALTTIVGHCVLVEPATLDRWLDALWDRWPGHPGLLGGVVRMGGSLTAVRALEWSVRLRQAGLTDRCPLAARLADRSAPPTDRLRAAGLALAAFGTAPEATDVADAASAIATDELAAVLTEVDQLAPGLLPAIIAGAASNRARCVALARLLDGWGASDEAGALVEQAFGHRDLDAAEALVGAAGAGGASH